MGCGDRRQPRPSRRAFRLPAEVDLRSLGALPVKPPETLDRIARSGGSNNWAVAGSRTAHGAALVANDMHLDLRVPNIWYRARLIDASARWVR